MKKANAAKSLWIAAVEHESDPGTIPVLFYQENEPSDRVIKSRFARAAKPSELTVAAGPFNLSEIARRDPQCMTALQSFASDMVKLAEAGPNA
ncbi:hypothetical protein [Paraburkholderia sp. SIMBA_054]|uniref:hypothetical protein n=1 Tax=Paraburkholderia sp. SIMBA_054 TaxID=3085795 RepID=UPI00397C1606